MGRNTAWPDSSPVEGGLKGRLSGNARCDVDKASRCVGPGSAWWSVAGRVSGGVRERLVVARDKFCPPSPDAALRSSEPGSPGWASPSRDSGVFRGDPGVVEDELR
jgi:hypothetical protein